jgi:hypothetical protein
MSMLTFYINRTGRQLHGKQRARLEAAKDELRALFARPRQMPHRPKEKRGERTARSLSIKRKTTNSSGNVFVDLGFDRDEAAVLQLRANLMSNLRLYIEKRRLTQAQPAKQLGIA